MFLNEHVACVEPQGFRQKLLNVHVRIMKYFKVGHILSHSGYWTGLATAHPVKYFLQFHLYLKTLPALSLVAS